MNDYNKKRLYIIIALVVGVILIGGITYAFFNYSKTSVANSMSSSTIEFDFTDDTLLDVSNDFPQYADLTNEEMVTMKSNHTGSLTVTGHNTLANGIKYSIYVIHGDDITGKQRLADSSIKFQLEPDFTSGENGFTVLTNNYSSPTNLVFDNDGKALISTGLVKDTTELTEVNYNFYMWLDASSMHISSTMKRATLPEGNPSLADTTSGNVTSSRYLKNDGVLVNDVTLFPASSNEDGKIIYTTNEFSNGYYNIKFLVEAEEGKPTGESKVKAAILAKQEAETNSCNPVWIDDNGTASDESDDITYFSGDNNCVDMNYVWYSGKLWRITAIYPDGAMKLVTENNITSIAFNASGQVNFYTDANTTSYMYQWLNENFYDTLYNANGFIDTSKQWNATMPADTNVGTKPLETNMVTANVGLLNNYEYYNSYRCIGSSTCTGSSYSTGYLNIGYYWWLLNPYNALGVWHVYNGGSGGSNLPSNTNGARPSIYLKSGLEFTGDGSKQSPYKIVGDKDTGAANELVNTRISGEYVKLKNGNNEQLFRIIGVEDNKTKIIAMDYADNKATKKFAVGNTSGDGTIYGTGQTATQGEDTWYNYLTGTYEPNLETTYGPLFDSSTYYMGEVGEGQSYKLGICSTSTGLTKTCTKTSQVGTFNIGLPRYGEMFATQQSGGYSNSTAMWLINRYSTSSIWIVYNSGDGNNRDSTSTCGARPTVHLKSGVRIISGTGTETEPYVVGL